jgi:large subunit ribosomal protein L18
MNRLKKKLQRRDRIRKGLRKKIRGTSERPRLSVYRSNNAIYAQLVNDVTGETLAAASSLGVDKTGRTPVELAKSVGQELADKAKQANVSTAVFDRNGYLYHGRVKALAEGARENGLIF